MIFGGINLNKDIFEPVFLENMEFKNCFVMAAAADNLTGEGGKVTEAHINRLVELAEGDVGLIIPGGVGINDRARSGPNTPNMDRKNAVKEYKNLTKRLHECGAKIAIQLVHSGIWTSHYQNSLNKEAIGAYDIPLNTPYLNEGLLPSPGKFHAATEEEIINLIDAFAEAAYKGKKAGFDACEIHAAHDSLLAQFLSPITNKRNDEWGGSLEKRAHIHFEIGEAIKNKLGDDFLLIIKLGLKDGVTGGTKLEEGLKAAEIVSNSGYDIIEVSLGLQGGKLKETVFKPIPPEGMGNYHDWCRKLKKKVNIPIIQTGGLKSPADIQKIISQNHADMIGMCRPFIREPGLVKRWQEGNLEDAECIRCNKCVFALGKGMPLDCYVEEKISM
jgi:2,4-dienoyl-CoA reductase-like NADH-dependent reductase (Old Yellow Enzyme family)